MTCSLCPKVALYMAGKVYYCRDHRAEAVARTSEIGIGTQSRQSIDWYCRERTIAKRYCHTN